MAYEIVCESVGWEPTCGCVEIDMKTPVDVEPCTVLDPFIGSGTTCCVALANGRRSIGIDLSEKYLRESAIVRIEGALMSRPNLVSQTGKKPKVFTGGKGILD
jgi:hypothetical protein